jgi:NADPH2:quinone reductase
MSCLVYGASGVIGQLLVQLAKRAGATVLAVTSTPERADVVEALGVDGVFLQHGPVADGVRDATGGTGVDVVFDAVGRATLRESMRATRVRGLVVNYGSVSGSLDDLDPIELGEAGSLFLTRPRLADHLQDAETAQRRADDVFGHLLEGTLVIPLAGLREWDEVEAAHDDLEHRRSTGKAVLRVA